MGFRPFWTVSTFCVTKNQWVDFVFRAPAPRLSVRLSVESMAAKSVIAPAKQQAIFTGMEVCSHVDVVDMF